MFFKRRCYNGGNKHKFKPRYEETEVRQENVKMLLLPSTPLEARTMLVKKTYVKDICVWCGKSIEK